MKREPSQGEVDTLLNTQTGQAEETAAVPYDFARKDLIPKAQLRAIQFLNEEFARAASSSLSMYLRSFVRMTLTRLEQVTYAEFLAGVNTPSCIVFTSVSPHEATAVLEITPPVAAAIIEILLGGAGTTPPAADHKITDIEKALINTALKMILHDFEEAWRPVAEMRLTVQSIASGPEMYQAFPPTEGVIAIAMDVTVGQSSGTLTVALPAIFVKRLSQSFEHARESSKSKTSDKEQQRVKALLQDVSVQMEVLIDAGMVDSRTLLDLEAGDVIGFFDCPMTAQPTAVVNGGMRFPGSVAQKDGRLVFEVAGAKTRPSPVVRPEDIA